MGIKHCACGKIVEGNGIGGHLAVGERLGPGTVLWQSPIQGFSVGYKHVMPLNRNDFTRIQFN